MNQEINGMSITTHCWCNFTCSLFHGIKKYSFFGQPSNRYLMIVSTSLFCSISFRSPKVISSWLQFLTSSVDNISAVWVQLAVDQTFCQERDNEKRQQCVYREWLNYGSLWWEGLCLETTMITKHVLWHLVVNDRTGDPQHGWDTIATKRDTCAGIEATMADEVEWYEPTKVDFTV